MHDCIYAHTHTHTHARLSIQFTNVYIILGAESHAVLCAFWYARAMEVVVVVVKTELFQQKVSAKQAKHELADEMYDAGTGNA